MTSPGVELVRAARMVRWAREHPPGSNAGEFIDYALRRCGLDPSKLTAAEKPWCAAGLSAAASDWFGVAWPLPLSASVVTIYEAAKSKGMLVPRSRVEVGCLFFVWSARRKRFAHIGIVSGMPDLTLSANTSKPGDTNPETMREGWGWFEKPWPFGPKDAFAKWW